jgi:hypothetical protein
VSVKSGEDQTEQFRHNIVFIEVSKKATTISAHPFDASLLLRARDIYGNRQVCFKPLQIGNENGQTGAISIQLTVSVSQEALERIKVTVTGVSNWLGALVRSLEADGGVARLLASVGGSP